MLYTIYLCSTYYTPCLMIAPAGRWSNSAGVFPCRWATSNTDIKQPRRAQQPCRACWKFVHHPESGILAVFGLTVLLLQNHVCLCVYICTPTHIYLLTDAAWCKYAFICPVRVCAYILHIYSRMQGMHICTQLYPW